jgi:superfamily II DNA or RNA helicase
VTTPRELRPYQREAVDAVLRQWGNETRRTAVVLPTGTGKSTVIAKLAVTAGEMGLRVAMLAHRGELLDQMAATVGAVDPYAPPVGICRAEQDAPHHQIVAASFQTLANSDRHAALGRRDVLLVDETHHVTADSYRRVVEDFGPNAFMCGFTATLRREDGKALRELIHSIAFERNLRWALGEGHLVRPKGITVKIPDLDLGKVKTTAGDFQNRDLAEVMEAETPEIVKAVLKHTSDRRPIIFAASVMAAHDIAAMLVDHGMQAEAVTGEMGYDLRQGIYRRYRDGSTQALVTVMVLTEGADFPMCDAVVIARPTQSQNLYSQMVGRALRLYPGKQDALVVDLVGTSRVLKLVTVSNLDAGVTPKVVDPDGNDLPPDEDDEVDGGLIAPTARQRRMGPIETIGIDLLGPDETNVLWLTTVKGVPFVAPQESDFAWFLWEVGYDENEPLYRVGRMPIKGREGGGWLTDDPLPLTLAVAFTEDDIMSSGYGMPVRSASWRKYQPPSEAQLRYARGLGIINPEDMTKARLSDEINIALVSRRLDGSR